ncbi:hypothetical protein N0P26_003509 [Acinetobacter baumannii]|uniref:Uncharacterized protein n=1 Tax=Acinetobacter baumannii TaxID=470 RepID=A0A9P2L9U0_ACIBA|nr:hypothetical protein [Acinetobacter baumannii]EKT9125792.1 hypothetical protein [Acinetobacter baumannii]EKT9272678.1 hypothetical protein [Acinetobacter baumannii]EKT9314726.1 hypothetical protein [Acinetobacter baumannii]EKU0110712.1 hypothetical protein [Acinetobacter baumannii]EKU0261221.1 hypothetical protein [Acinetobacter baumannii]
MTLNERELFEEFELSKRPCAKPESLFERFDSNGLGESEQHYVGKYVDSYMQEKWELWQKAKAKAVPDTHMVLPKVADKKMINAGYEAHDGFYTNGQVQDVYQAMVKASESGAEG